MKRIPVKQLDLTDINSYYIDNENTAITLLATQGSNYIYESPLTSLTLNNTTVNNPISDFIYPATIRFKCGDTPTNFKHNADVIKWAQSSLPALEPNGEYVIALWKGIGVMKELKTIDDYTIPMF